MIRRIRKWLGFDDVQHWTRGEKVTCIGLLLFLFGASAADSVGTGSYISAGISVVGLILLGAGVYWIKQEEKSDAESFFND